MMESFFKHTLTWLLAVMLGVFSANASATLIFSDVEVTPNSVAFTVNGNMTGYADPRHMAQFSIRYAGDLWVGLDGFTPNRWSGTLFDTHLLESRGNTGSWGSLTPYSWSVYDHSFWNATALDRRLTLTMGRDYLNPAARSGALHFVWGNGHSSTRQQILHTINFSSVNPRYFGPMLRQQATSVPEPGTMALLWLGLAGIFVARRRASA